MARSINKVTLLGNIGSDPELKQFGANSCLKFSLATSDKYKDRNGELQEKTEWHRVSIWGKRGEGLSRILGKGERVYVEGSIKYSKTDEGRYFTDIDAREIVLCGGKREGGGDYQRSAPRQPSLPSNGGYDENDDIPFLGASNDTRLSPEQKRGVVYAHANRRGCPRNARSHRP